MTVETAKIFINNAKFLIEKRDSNDKKPIGYDLELHIKEMVSILERETPIVPKMEMNVTVYRCPSCEARIERGQPFCYMCHQHIDWKEVI